MNVKHETSYPLTACQRHLWSLGSQAPEGMTSGRVHLVYAPGDRSTITKEPYMARVAGPVAELSRADFAHAGQGS